VVFCVGGEQTNERVNDFENICIKCGKMISEQPTTGRFNTVILYGRECAWNPDNEFDVILKLASTEISNPQLTQNPDL
jgi:hypothetical protein